MRSPHLVGPVCVCVCVCVIAFVCLTAHAEPNPNQGTWETSLQPRSHSGDLSTIAAYYDSVLNVTWLADANLAASNTFGLQTGVSLGTHPSDTSGVDGNINADGTLNWPGALFWIDAMNYTNYLGVNQWRLPTVNPINGATFITSRSNNATTDIGHASTTTDGTDGGWRDSLNDPVAEMAHIFYVNLGNLGTCQPDNANPTGCTGQSNSGLKNTGPFANIQSRSYWTDVEHPSDSRFVWKLDFSAGERTTLYKPNNVNVWALTDGDPLVPITVIDFTGLETPSNSDTLRLASPYTEDGFVLSGIGGAIETFFGYWGPLASWGWTGNPALYQAGQGSEVFTILSQENGKPFDLVSIDLSEYASSPIYNSPNVTSVTFIGEKADGSGVNQTLVLDGIYGLETFAFTGFENVVSVKWNIGSSGLESFHQFDNIKIFVPDTDLAPVADAGENIEVPIGELVSLNGFNSNDDVDLYYQLLYDWTLTSAPQGSLVSLQNSTSITPTFTPDLPGLYLLELVVTDTSGQNSIADEIEVHAGIVPSYVFQKIAEGSQAFSRNGEDYYYNNNFPQAISSGDNELMFQRYTSSYDTTTKVSTYDISINEADGIVIENRLSRNMMISPTDTLRYFSDVRRMPDGGIRFGGNLKRTDTSGTRYFSGAFNLDQNDVLTSLIEFPQELSGEQRIVNYGYGFRYKENILAFQSRKQPTTYKEWEYTDNQGITRVYRYADSEAYVFRNGELNVVWDTLRTIPGSSKLAFSINLADVSDNGDVLIRASFPNEPSDPCPNCWSTTLVKVLADGTVSSVVDLSSGPFADYYIGQAEFDSNDDVIVALSGYRNGRYDSSIYRSTPYGLARLVSGPYVGASGSNTYSHIQPSNFSHFDGNFLFNGYPSIMARIDGRMRKVVTRGDTMDGVTPQYINVYPRQGNDLLGRDSVGVNGTTQTLYDHTSSTQYSYAYDHYVFFGRLDTDRDGVIDGLDNCPQRPNSFQEDVDGNNIGDVCEDSDVDGYFDPDDNCPLVANTSQLDTDQDSFGDSCDVCPLVADDQTDGDNDGLGDACDPDNDNDNVDDTFDNCPLVYNPAPQSDIDNDGTGDPCDPDKDNDGIANGIDGIYFNSIFTDQSELESNNFTDEHLGGSTVGVIVHTRPGITWRVEDGPDSSVGVLITTNGLGKLAACGNNKLITWAGGTTAELTCGSTSVKTLFGLIEIDVDELGEIVVSVPQGADAKVIDDTTDEFAILVSPASNIPVTANLGDSTSIEIEAATTAIVEEPSPGQYEITNSTGSEGAISVESNGNIVTYQPGDKGIPVAIDIKPGDLENNVNLGSRGNVPVAILTSNTFDATTIDPYTVTLASAPVRLKGKGTAQSSINDINMDGRPDMVVHIDTSALQLSTVSVLAELTGKTTDGLDIRGSDFVRVVPD